MSEIKLLRFQCPAGHLVAGIGFDTEDTSEDKAQAIVLVGLMRINANPWCALCGSRDLKFKTDETVYKEMVEIAPIITAELEKRQQINRLKRNAHKN